jgi:hypothetical protein
LATSGTYAFSPSVGNLALSAYSRIQIRRPALLPEHMADAAAETNYMLSSWSNMAPNLWTVDLVTQTLTASTATYSVDAKTVMILDAYITVDSQDRLIFPISRTEYASYVNKTDEGVPTVFWFNRILAPTITLWLVPDSNATYTLNYYRCTQNQDANLQSGETPAIPYRFIDAMVAGLAHRLARIYKPELEQVREQDAMKALAIAQTQDVENVPMSIQPQLQGYYQT